jgi:hypothetical protein
MPRENTFRSVVLSLFCLTLAATKVVAWANDDPPRKQLHATRIPDGGIELDGRLDDPAWQQAPPITDFTQKLPDEGASPTYPVEVRVLYDEDALYIGGRMYCGDTKNLRLHLERKDSQGPAEQLIVVFDSYYDRRTAYGFGINSAGVRFDRFHPSDEEGDKDFSYEPVWEGRTALGQDYWTAEMRIPFSQLRFNRQDEQRWGINFNHWVPQRNEDVFWVMVPRDEVGYASRFGDLTGIEGIKPSRRLEVLPYGAANARVMDVPEEDPFRDDTEFDGHFGADVKMGLGPNLTLDATINPDFGQVEADPAEVNLSAYETYFEEKRPFFTEGNNLFEADGPAYFYSRRIGQAPHGRVDGTFRDFPNNTTILGAAKVTGRLASGTSVGVLAAVTEREHARGYFPESDSTITVEVEPLTTFGVMRLQQDFGEDQSTAGIILTGMHRDIDDDHPLLGSLRKDAITGGADWNLRFKDGMYVLEGYAGFSHVRGDSSAILAAQYSSAHYFQRPDQDHVALDPAATSMTGTAVSLEFAKESGRHWLGGVGFEGESPGFELNDAGILNSADDIVYWGYGRYRETRPGVHFQDYSIEVEAVDVLNYGGIRQGAELSLASNATWKNYTRTYLNLALELPGQSDDLTRGGPLMKTKLEYSLECGVHNDHSATTGYGITTVLVGDELDGWLYLFSGDFSTRVGNRGQISLAPTYRRQEKSRQYVATVSSAGGGEQTFGNRYVFSRIAASELSLQLRVNYYFTPDLSLALYAEPFTASGRFFGHGELLRARDNQLREYGADGTTIGLDEDGNYLVTDGAALFTIPNHDYGYQSFRSNVVLRWEFLRGSTLYVVWQRNLEDEHDPGRNVRPKALFDAFDARGEDFVALKISYWLPIS